MAMKTFKPTQNMRLFDYLSTGKTITPLEAWSELGIYRLSARVYDLRMAGHDVTSRITGVSNRFGEVFRVAEYRFVDRKKEYGKLVYSIQDDIAAGRIVKIEYPIERGQNEKETP